MKGRLRFIDLVPGDMLVYDRSASVFSDAYEQPVPSWFVIAVQRMPNELVHVVYMQSIDHPSVYYPHQKIDVYWRVVRTR